MNLFRRHTKMQKSIVYYENTKLQKTRSQLTTQGLRAEPTSRLRENQNKEKELFLKIA